MDKSYAKNINKLLKILISRLKSNPQYFSEPKPKFNTEMLVDFLNLSLSAFNQIPYFTAFDFSDDDFVDKFSEVLVDIAEQYAIASKKMIDDGNEFVLNDSGIYFDLSKVKRLKVTAFL